MADYIVKRLKSDLAKAEEQVRHWQDIADGFRKTIMFYESAMSGVEAADTTSGGVQMLPAARKGGSKLPDAIYAVLRDAGMPLHFKVITQRLLTQGVTIPGKDQSKNVGAHMSTDDRFKNVDRGMWALAEQTKAASPFPMAS